MSRCPSELDKAVFRLHVLPAGIGDALLIEYGSADAIHRVLIDGGIASAEGVVREHLGDHARLELLCVTHIDSDHIAGVIALLGKPTGPTADDVWFNGYRHLPPVPELKAMGPAQGERLTKLLDLKGYNWNGSFNRQAVVRPDATADADLTTRPPMCTLPGGLECTVLSPGLNELKRLRDKTTWAEVVRDAEQQTSAAVNEESAAGGPLLPMGAAIDVDALADEPSVPDTSPANGSSIVLLVKFGEARCLLAGDAHADVLLAGVDQLVDKGNALDVDVFKLPHHGSKANVTRNLISRIPAHTYIFSTDGSGRQCHPDDQAVARVIKYGQSQPTLAFNYRSPQNRKWDSTARRRRHHYSTSYPTTPDGGLVVDVLAAHRDNRLRAAER